MVLYLFIFFIAVVFTISLSLESSSHHAHFIFYIQRYAYANQIQTNRRPMVSFYFVYASVEKVEMEVTYMLTAAPVELS